MMVKYILKKSLAVLATKPVMLWGVSLMSTLISVLVIISGLAVPIITIPIVLTIAAGMSALYLDSYNGKPISSKQLFAGFTKERIPRVTGGMCWYYLWSIIWAFVPVAGIVKAYSYRFTPYILITRPEIGPMEALKLSMLETKGYKLIMFLTDLIIFAAIVVVTVILSMLSLIPHVGFLFGALLGLFSLALSLFLQLFYGIVGAAFYQETKNGTYTAASYKPARYNPSASENAVPAVPEKPELTPKEGEWLCGDCGALNAAGTIYCRACGKKHE